jgi:hypothetical protein
MNFTGDIAFKEKLARVLEKNELNGKSPYALYFATKNSKSGWSFGIPQYDLSTRNGRALFQRILNNAQDANGNFIVDDGDPLPIGATIGSCRTLSTKQTSAAGIRLAALSWRSLTAHFLALTASPKSMGPWTTLYKT